MNGARIIGLGQPFAGDDAVGLAVVGHLRGLGIPPGVELCEEREPLALISLLAMGRRIVLVDAVIGTPVSEVREIALGALDPRSPTTTSSHGLGLAGAIALASALSGERHAPLLRLVGVTVRRVRVGSLGLSPEVAAAVPRAAALALQLAAFRG